MESSSRSTASFPVMPLVAMGLGVLILANDFSALNVALPQIEKDFDAQVSTVQWVVNAYALVFGMLIVAGGRLADIFGRRRIFFTGAAIFTAFSILGGAAQSIEWLIAARCLMGIGGALMWPAILGMTYAALPEDKAGLAGGLILGAAGLGNVIGPLLGGALTDLESWRWIFFANVPIAAFAVLVTAVEDAPDRGANRGRAHRLRRYRRAVGGAHRAPGGTGPGDGLGLGRPAHRRPAGDLRRAAAGVRGHRAAGWATARSSRPTSPATPASRPPAWRS